MKYFLIYLVVMSGITFYIYTEQPRLWAKMLAIARIPGATDNQTPPASSDDNNNSAVTRQTPTPPGPVMITPGTTNFLDPTHVIPVEETAPAAPLSKTFAPPDTLPAQPDWTWTTTDGHVYKNVIVDKVEADRVTILYDGGGAYVDIATLPPDIQSQLNYRPDWARAAQEERATSHSPK
jgi:hypothetical protein